MRKFTSSFVAAALAATFAISSIVPVTAAPVVAPRTAESGVIQVQEGFVERNTRRYQRQQFRQGAREFRQNRRDFQRAQRREFRQDRRQFRRDIRRHGFYRDNNWAYYNGYRGYRYHRPGYRSHNGWWFPVGAFAAGAIIGGALSADRPYYGERVYRRSYSSAHVEWCYNRYRSYREWDNTFQPYHGPRQQCYSPYS